MKPSLHRKLFQQYRLLPAHSRTLFSRLMLLSTLLVGIDLVAILALYKVLAIIIAGSSNLLLASRGIDQWMGSWGTAHQLFMLALIFLVKNLITGILYHQLLKGCQKISSQIAELKMREQLRINPMVHAAKRNYERIHEVTSLTIQTSEQIILPSVVLLSELLLILLALIVAALAQWPVVVMLLFTITPATWLLMQLTRKKLQLLGKQLNEVHPALQQVVDMAILGYPEIWLHQQRRWILEMYLQLKIRAYRAKRGLYQFSGIIPPRIVESAIMISIFLLFALLHKQGQAQLASPLLLLYAALAFRLLPSVNRIVRSYHSLQTHSFLLDYFPSTYGAEEDMSVKPPLLFREEVALRKVTFRYPERQHLLLEADLALKKGKMTGLTGDSGSGKSTVAQLLCGFQKMEAGRLELDSLTVTSHNLQNWQVGIRIVRQDAYLFPGTISENIYFGELPNTERLLSACRIADILEWTESLPSGPETPIGPFGMQISGGQKQRIALARALYTEPQLLILDEATNALDLGSRKRIMQNLSALGDRVTMLIISHDEFVLNFCSETYRIENRQIHLQSN